MTVQHIFTGSTPPTSTPAHVGQHYIDTTHNVHYLSVNTNSPSDWMISTIDTSSVGIGYLDNEFTYSNFSNSAWIPLFGSATTGQADPSGGTAAISQTTASRGFDGIYKNFSTGGGVAYNFSVWAKGQSGGEVFYLGTAKNNTGLVGDIDVQTAITALTTSWVRYNINFTPTVSAQYIGIFAHTSVQTAKFYNPQLSSTRTYPGPLTVTGRDTRTGPGISAAYGIFDTIKIQNAISPFYLETQAGVGGNAHRLYYDSSGDALYYVNNGGTSQKVAVAGGGTPSVASSGTVNFSSGTASISDGAITSSSILVFTLTSASSPGVIQYNASSGSASCQSYNTGFAGMNNSDGSTYAYLNFI